MPSDCGNKAFRIISVSELPSFNHKNAPPLNDILFSYLQYHLAKPERKQAPLQISEADTNVLYLDSGNPTGIYDLAALLLLKS